MNGDRAGKEATYRHRNQLLGAKLAETSLKQGRGGEGEGGAACDERASRRPSFFIGARKRDFE
jgi:hypothetical protein